MTDRDRPRFVCSDVVTFDLSGLPAWVRAEQSAGRIAPGAVELEVLHPQREMDGSCRWCGCRENEIIRFAGTEEI